MTHRTGHGSAARPALRLAGLLLALAAAAAATSCAKKITNVDDALVPPNYPEGVANASRLIVYPDVPVPVETWQDNGEPGPDTSDVLLSTELVYSDRAGAVLGVIVDHTTASKFEVFRRQGTHGFIEVHDFAVQPTQTWLPSQVDVFHFSDSEPYPAGQRQYVARGIVSGVVTNNAPLTNLVTLSASTVPASLQYTARILPDTTRDSTFVMRWTSVPTAAGYWITITNYPPSYLANDALIRFALPRPVPFERIPDVYVAYVPDPNGLGGQPMLQKLGDPLPAGGTLIHEDVGTNGSIYFVRVVAVDAAGQMIAYVGASGSYGQASVLEPDGDRAAGLYRLFPMGGVFVQPQAEPPPPPELATSRAGGPASLHPIVLPNGTRFYDGAELRRVLRR